MIRSRVRDVSQAGREGQDFTKASDKPRLIAVDDEMEMAALIAEIGELVGFEAEVAGDARQFFQAWQERTHDVIVIDLFMPDTDGFELIEMLADQGCKAAIIMVSGYDKRLLNGAGTMAKARGLNLRGILTKPFHIEEIKALLQEIVTGESA